MPTSGGAAGKAGDTYEALWTVDAAIRIIRGEAEFIEYETLDPEKSLGVEFHLKRSDGLTEYWSVKRQTTKAAGWTLSLLTKLQAPGRSILQDLSQHTERDESNVAVFASTMLASDLEELRSYAKSSEMLRQRLAESKELKQEFEKYLLPVFQNEQERARDFLLRLKVVAQDELSLRERTESYLSLLFYSTDKQFDPAEVRRLIAEYLLQHLHLSIGRAELLQHLESHNLRLRDWKLDRTTRDQIADLCMNYTEPILSLIANDNFLSIPGAEELLNSNTSPPRLSLVSGAAGSGKSTLLAQFVTRTREKGIPVLPIRFDLLEEGILTSQNLGICLSLPASPVATLAGLADGDDCILVLDQLDSVSLTSGRKVALWNLFEIIKREAEHYPNLRLVISCRQFDLKHDHRMRELTSAEGLVEKILLAPLKTATVDDALGDRTVHQHLKPILTVPLHLSMFLSLETPSGATLSTRDQLFEAFWVRKLRDAEHRRSGGNYSAAIDTLCQWLSENQELSAPVEILDHFGAEAEVLASENLFIRLGDRYAFFHESFFDYAYARGFLRDTKKTVRDLLLSDEQHLFRRAQVRQVLSFLRTKNEKRYLREIESVLAENEVRFHIKRNLLRFLDSVDEPTPKEWHVLKEVATKRPEMKSFVHGTVANRPGWFNALDADGFFESLLISDDPEDHRLAIWMFAQPATMEKCSERIADVLRKYRQESEDWRNYLQAVCRNGWVYHSRPMFDLFLSLLEDGTLDGVRPGFAVNDTWWSTLFSIAHKAPELACEALATWIRRVLNVWREEARLSETSDYERLQGLRVALDASGSPGSTLSRAAQAPEAFVRHLLPFVVELCLELSSPSCGEELGRDELSPYRSYDEPSRDVYESVFATLAVCLERLAQENPDDLDRQLDPYVLYNLEPTVYLTLRAWTANPIRYADRLVEFLISNPRRLTIGYSWHSGEAGPGVAEALRSIRAVESASPLCKDELYSSLEELILDCTPALLGDAHQFQFLTVMDESRLSTKAKVQRAELKSRLPGITSDPPRSWALEYVGPPVSDKDQEEMTDDQWLKALGEFAGVETSNSQRISMSGGERELANTLEERTKNNAERFLRLSAQMPTSFPGSYFTAFIYGLAKAPVTQGSWPEGVETRNAVALLEKAHALQDRPCGRAISNLVSRKSKVKWPLEVTRILSWYATEDPDPEEELWRKPAGGGETYYRGDPDLAGLNSVRGGAAGAIADLLFADAEYTKMLLPTVETLSKDSSIAVRARSIPCLLALLNTHPESAIKLFLECIGIDPVLLTTRDVYRFLYYGAYRDPEAIRPILQQMLKSASDKQVKFSANIICRLALGQEVWEGEAHLVRNGSPVARAAAAAVYGTNASDAKVGTQCVEHLVRLLADRDKDVQREAADVFEQLSLLKTSEQAKLLGAFLDANPTADSLEPVIRELENSTFQLPDLVCRLVEIAVDAFIADAGDIRSHSALYSPELSKIVVRLYRQTDNEKTKRRCLDAIDKMERENFYGLADELNGFER